ncbi:MutT-like nucleotide pyrophosphohydrolase [Streptomyces phage YDN12]|uniref:MutT-like nucleotide pyrophosphohydrolase n=1 Tax=Streptomyces phage YDN12 TaxID=1636183 RepID=A0A0E3JJF3_9CAUD|nr:MutT/NUDIX hydrolase [Streptomyces phage YDN12]AKA61732.1 MutT-like nucleotide pyrophosphohydrolase [Streptomyces phage YDN12]
MTDVDETISLTVDIAVFRTDGYVLLIERGWDPFKGHWALPGGYVNRGEASRDAAARELYEETRVPALPAELTRVDVFDAPGRDPRGRVVSVAYMLEVIPGTEVRAGDDAVDARWWPLSELPPLAFDHAEIIAAARNI